MAEVANPLAKETTGEAEWAPLAKETTGQAEWENEHARCVRGSAPAWHSNVVDCRSETDDATTAEGKFPQYSPDGRWVLYANGPGTISVVDARSRTRVAEAREEVKRILRSGPRDWFLCCFSPDSREVIVLGPSYEDKNTTRLVAYDIATQRVRAQQDIWKEQSGSCYVRFASGNIHHQCAMQPVPHGEGGRNWIVLRAHHFEETTETQNLSTVICDVSTLQLRSFVDGWSPLAPLPDGESIALAWAPTEKSSEGREFRGKTAQQRENQAFVIVVPLDLLDGAVELDPVVNWRDDRVMFPVSLPIPQQKGEADTMRSVLLSEQDLGLSECMVDILLRERNDRAQPFRELSEFMSGQGSARDATSSPAGIKLLERLKIRLFEPGFGCVLR